VWGVVAVRVAVVGLVALGVASSRGVRLSPDVPGTDANFPRVAVDARGDGFAVWAMTTPAGVVTESATKLEGRAWSPSRVLASGGDAGLSVDARGDAVVAGRALGDRSGVFAVYRRAGSSWGSARFLSRSGAGFVCCATAIDGAGRALVAFTSGTNVEVATRSRDGAWRMRVLASGFGPVAAMDARGDALVVWHAANDPNAPILASWKLAGGSWQRPQFLREPPREFVFLLVLQVALDARGGATVLSATYTDGPPRTYWVNAATARLGGRFTLSRRIGGGGDWVSPALAVASSGRAAVVFVPGYTDGAVFIAVRAAASKQFGAPVRLAQQLAFNSAVALTDSGRVLALWTQSDGWSGHLTLDAAIGSTDGSFSRPFDLARIGRDCFAHRCLPGGQGTVALDAAGRGVVAWVEKAEPTSTDPGGAVYARNVAASPEPGGSSARLCRVLAGGNGRSRFVRR
jgi:hypothetical protein